jgi:hypothetical protein
MDNLCDLFAGAQIKEQHPYFEMAKKDIYELADQYVKFKHYNNSVLSLVNHCKILDPDLYNLNIVIQYIITYGNALFISYLQTMKVDSYHKNDYEEYLNAYVEDVSAVLH